MAVFFTPPYFDSISGNSFLQIIADPKYPTRCAWHPPSSMTGACIPPLKKAYFVTYRLVCKSQNKCAYH